MLRSEAKKNNKNNSSYILYKYVYKHIFTFRFSRKTTTYLIGYLNGDTQYEPSAFDYKSIEVLNKTFSPHVYYLQMCCWKNNKCKNKTKHIIVKPITTIFLSEHIKIKFWIITVIQNIHNAGPNIFFFK